MRRIDFPIRSSKFLEGINMLTPQAQIRVDVILSRRVGSCRTRIHLSVAKLHPTQSQQPEAT